MNQQSVSSSTVAAWVVAAFLSLPAGADAATAGGGGGGASGDGAGRSQALAGVSVRRGPVDGAAGRIGAGSAAA